MTDSTGLPITTVSILVTREVRWFHDGALPDAVLEWFDPEGTALQESRADVYDLVHARRGIGLKYRGGLAYDTKHRTSVHEPLVLAGAVGRIEDWLKVSHPIDGRQGIEAPVVVEKRIHTRRYEFSPAMPDGDGSGCEAELSSLRIGGDDYWSFALETFGPPSQRGAALQEGLQVVLEDTPLPEGLKITGLVSCGYPEFLADLPTEPERASLGEAPTDGLSSDGTTGWAPS